MPGYEPRTMQSMALGLAVNARGADHNRSGAYEADLKGGLDRVRGTDEHVRAAIETEDRAAVMDSLILCKFLRGVFTEPFAEWAQLLSKVTGWDVDGDELHETGTTHRAGQARLQPPGGLDPRRRLASRAVPRQPARARVRSYGDTARRPAAHHDRHLLRRTRPGPGRPAARPGLAQTAAGTEQTI